VLLTLFGVLAVTSMHQKSITGDEVTHLPAGYTYVKTGDFRLNPQHPPLIKALAGLPLLLLDLKPVADTAGWTEAREWVFGNDFLVNNRHPIERIVFMGRLPMVGVGLLLGLVLFLWARDLWGYWPGVFVLFLYALSPDFLAHTQVVHTDVGVSCFTVLALYALWRFSRSGRLTSLLWCGLALGLTLLSKYSGVVTVAVAWVLFLARWRWRTSETSPTGAETAHEMVAAGLRARRNPFVQAQRPAPTEELDLHFHGATRGRRCRKLALPAITLSLLPALLVMVGFGFPDGLTRYLYGFTSIHADANPHWEGFLWGEYSKTGFWYYYLLAEFWKTPIPTLVCFGAALFLVTLPDRRTAVDWAFILVPIAAFHGAAMLRPASIGVRHVLPAFPFVLLACGATARWVGQQRVPYRIVFALLCMWQLAGTLRVYPHFIPYFNAFAGGPDGGIQYLDDSNIEWGQDFYLLRDYIDATRPPTVRLSAFKPIRPEHYGIKWEAMSLRDVVWPQPGITYCAGASYLQRSSLYNEYSGVRFHWLTRYRPVHKLGWSIYVYRFSTDPADAHNPAVYFIPREKWYDDAIETLVPIVGRSPAFTEAKRLLAEVYAARGSWREEHGDLQAAVLDYLSAVNMHPQAPQYRVQFRDLVTRLPAALDAPDDTPALLHFNEAAVHFRSQNQGQALLALLRCLQRDPNHLLARLNLGSVFAQLGFPALAQREWERCLSINPDFALARQNLAQLAKQAEHGSGPRAPAEVHAP
jgi:tetratricopeptide (TPR) repeat protein